MARRFGIMVCLTVILVVMAVSAVRAQDDSLCNTFALSSELREIARKMEETSSLERTLDELEEWAAAARTYCVDPSETDTGLVARPDPEALFTFSSEEEGNDENVSLGPVYMPYGLYKVRLETDGIVSGKLEQVEGSCYLLSIFDLFSIYDPVETGNVVERVIYADGCEANFNLQGATGTWNIVVSEYLDTDTTPVGQSYSSEENGTMPALGPLTFEDGTYEFTLTTAGFMIMSVQPLYGDCETEVSGRFISVRPNEATGGVTATLTTSFECTAFITTDNVSAPWSLTIVKKS